MITEYRERLWHCPPSSLVAYNFQVIWVSESPHVVQLGSILTYLGRRLKSADFPRAFAILFPNTPEGRALKSDAYSCTAEFCNLHRPPLQELSTAQRDYEHLQVDKRRYGKGIRTWCNSWITSPHILIGRNGKESLVDFAISCAQRLAGPFSGLGQLFHVAWGAALESCS